MAAMTTTKSNGMVKRVLCLILAGFILITAMSSCKTEAASVKKATKSYCPMYADGGFRFLDIYGKDTFKITYDGSKVINVTASQSERTLGSNMIQKGGIKLVKKTKTEWTYKATWYFNLNCMPKSVQAIAAIMKMPVAAFGRLGRTATVTMTYTINKNAKLTYKKSVNWQMPSNLEKAVKKLAEYFI